MFRVRVGSALRWQQSACARVPRVCVCVCVLGTPPARPNFSYCYILILLSNEAVLLHGTYDYGMVQHRSLLPSEPAWRHSALRWLHVVGPSSRS